MNSPHLPTSPADAAGVPQALRFDAVPTDSLTTSRFLAEPNCAKNDGTVCSGVWHLTHQSWLARAADTVTAHGARIILIVVVALITRFLLHRAIRRLTLVTGASSVPTVLQPLKEKAAERLATTGLLSARRQQRAATIGSVLRSIASFVVFVVAFVLVLGELGLDLGPIIASAGVAGIAVGFGAQNLVKDFLAGMFMILEDQYGVGDLIDAGQASGTVEAVGLRTTRLRDGEGTVWYVRNGEVLRIGNRSQGHSLVVLDIPVAYTADTDRAGALMLETAQELAREDEWQADFLQKPELLGIQDLTPDSVVLRLTAKTAMGKDSAIASELRARLRTRLVAAEIPLA
jgi:small-conductance mechanosensitive channel